MTLVTCVSTHQLSLGVARVNEGVTQSVIPTQHSYTGGFGDQVEAVTEVGAQPVTSSTVNDLEPATSVDEP